MTHIHVQNFHQSTRNNIEHVDATKQMNQQQQHGQYLSLGNECNTSMEMQTAFAVVTYATSD